MDEPFTAVDVLVALCLSVDPTTGQSANGDFHADADNKGMYCVHVPF